MKFHYFIFLVIISCNLFANSYKQEQQPYISYEEGEYILYLPSEMQVALHKFNASFIHWNTKDYTSKILTDLKENDNSNKAPFALIIDVNKDGKLDIILDGHDKNKDMLICIISNDTGYNVLLIDEHPISYPEEIENYNDGKKEYGLNYYLWINKQTKENDAAIFTKAIPQQSNAIGELMNDGVIIEYYFKDGKFIEEKQIL